MSENTPVKDRSKELGALWSRVSSNGNAFLSGYLTDSTGAKTPIVAFFNPPEKKKNANEPDWRLLLSTPPSNAAQPAKVAQTTAPKSVQDFVPASKSPAKKPAASPADAEDDLL